MLSAYFSITMRLNSERPRNEREGTRRADARLPLFRAGEILNFFCAMKAAEYKYSLIAAALLGPVAAVLSKVPELMTLVAGTDQTSTRRYHRKRSHNRSEAGKGLARGRVGGLATLKASVFFQG